MTRARWIASAVTALALIGLAVLWRGRTGAVDPPRAVAGASPVGGPALGGGAFEVVDEPAAAEPATPGDPGDIDPASQRTARARLAETVATYRATMVYPLWSRPADGSTRHLTEWNRPVSAGQGFAADRDRRTIRADATLDRMFAASGAPIAVTVTAAYEDDGAPAPLDVVDCRVEWFNGEAQAWAVAGPVTLQRAGAGWTGRFVPASLPALRSPHEARVRVLVQSGEFSRELPLDFRYAVEPPVVVYGLVGDRVADGSLELTLDVDVRHVAPVSLQATLTDAAGARRIAVFDDFVRPTQLGRQRVPIRIFGKVLRDAGVDGPYRLIAVHGYAYRPELEPREQFFDRADDPPMVTRAYPAAGFSDAAFTSPDVKAKLEQYEQLDRELSGSGLPPP